MENKPFVFGVATSGDNFTDRKKETARLLSNFRHGVNTVLISPRRWGKTSLVRKVCRLAQSDTLKVVYLDIFSCRSEREFYDAFASAVLKQTSSKLEEWMENARLFLSRISPKISLGTEPMTDFSISLELNPKTYPIHCILCDYQYFKYHPLLACTFFARISLFQMSNRAVKRLLHPTKAKTERPCNRAPCNQAMQVETSPLKVTFQAC